MCYSSDFISLTDNYAKIKQKQKQKHAKMLK